MVGTHGMLEMRTPYEEATRVPLLIHDPRLEQVNLFDRPEQRDRLRAMAARLRLWQHRVGDPAQLPAV